MCADEVFYFNIFWAKNQWKIPEIFKKVKILLAKECRELFGKDSLLEINEKKLLLILKYKL